jgi:uncharacterized protein YyaL (SSP411 family)
VAPPVELVVMGRPDDPATDALVRAAHASFLPNVVVVGNLEGTATPDSPLFSGRTLVDGRPAAYVCRGYTCHLPVTEPAEVARQLAAGS